MNHPPSSLPTNFGPGSTACSRSPQSCAHCNTAATAWRQANRLGVHRGENALSAHLEKADEEKEPQEATH
eukprot:CAMPEP_0115832214 /NCGR_PEP_ID=MMETSP0287-20121206/2542_1 /TAXON_ID=412157 /ORGANISM="Chrysochromulina rotalis, Strain UIO044" /LENGTH=69 /DNA_ID=CAMNT_0003285591 /DNA_START=522 /DNA_END=731 /DNA_ORIENTATION=-